MRFLAFISALALLASITAYSATFLGVDIHRVLPNIWLLHLGMFGVLIPTALLLPKKRGERDFRWGDVWVGVPAWVRWSLAALVVFCLMNVAAFEFVCGNGGPSVEPDGSYAISSHGRIIRSITAEEYRRARGFEFRSFSCWWILCYSFALTVQLAEIGRQNTAIVRRYSSEPGQRDN